MQRQQHARHRLSDDGGGGEDEVGYDHYTRNTSDHPRIALAVRQQHEEGDAGAGPQQHRGADHVQELQREVEHQRSSRMPRATRWSSRIGGTFSIGPSGSLQSLGTRLEPITR